MFKMAKKILAFDGKSPSASASTSAAAPVKQDKDSSGGGGGKKSGDELNDFSKLEDDPRLPLNVRQIFKITKSWKAIARTMSKTGTAMFLNLFEQNQDLFYLFDRFQHLKGRELHESMELREHAATVMATLDQSINSLSDYDNFVTYLHSIGKFHRKVPGFRRAYFWKIEQPFLKAVKQTLDERCNETIEEIYKIAIKLIIETISEGYGEDKTDEAPARRQPGGGEGDGSGNGQGSSDGQRREAGQGAAGANNKDDNSGKPLNRGGGGGQQPTDDNGPEREIRLDEGKCASAVAASTSATTTAAGDGGTPTPAPSQAASHLHAGPGEHETKLGPTLFVLRQLLLALMASQRQRGKQETTELARLGQLGQVGQGQEETSETTSGVEAKPEPSLHQVGAPCKEPRAFAIEAAQIGKGTEARRGSGSLINCLAQFDSSTTVAGEQQQQQLKCGFDGAGNGRAHNQHRPPMLKAIAEEEANSSQPTTTSSSPGPLNQEASPALANQSSESKEDTLHESDELEPNNTNKTDGQQINRDSNVASQMLLARSEPLTVVGVAGEELTRQLTTWRQAKEEMSSNDDVPMANFKSPGSLTGTKARGLSIVSRLRIKQSSATGEATAGNHHFRPLTKVCTRNTRTKATAWHPKPNAASAITNTKLRLSTDPDDLKELIKLLMLAAASRTSPPPRQTAAT